MEKVREYFVSCWHCSALFNAYESTFCCHFEPTPLCLFCYNCFCDASEEYRTKLLTDAPSEFVEMKKRILCRREIRLGDLLLNAGKISKEDLELGIKMQNDMKIKLGEVLIRMGSITAEDLKLFLLDQKTIQEIGIGEVLPDPALVEKIGSEFCLRIGMIPIEIVEIDNKKILNFAIQRKEDVMQARLCEELSDYVLLPSLGKPEEMKILLKKIKAIKEVEDILLLD